MLHHFIISALFVSAVCNEIPEDNIQALRSRSRRFVGIPIRTETHPSVVLVLYHGRRICDASIISKNFILTAAHCVFGSWHRKTQVMIADGTVHKFHNVTNVEYHKDYRPSTGENNIALLKLTDPIAFEPGITSVKLPKKFADFSNYTHTLSYGWIEMKGYRSGLLLEALSNAIVALEVCAKLSGVTVESLEGFLCGTSNDPSKVSHQMTGGPATMGEYQVGIVMSERFSNDTPTFFTRVDLFRDWIDVTKSRLLKLEESSTAFYPLPKKELDFGTKYYGELIDDKNGTSTVAIVNSKNGTVICVGSIVASDMILTTARCAKKFSLDKMRARVFSRGFVKGFKEYKFIKVYVHNSFRMKPFPNVNDVALMRVKLNFVNSGIVHKTELIAKDEKVQPPALSEVYGLFNKINVRRMEALLVEKDECDWIYEKIGGLTEGVLCAKSRNGWCNHVAGEPLIVEKRLVGILSAASEECGDPRVPAIFINVTTNLKWINRKLFHLNEIEEGL